MDATKVLNLQTKIVPIDRVHPNPWNPNKQDERTYEAQRQSIRDYGFIDPVTCRRHPVDAKGRLVGERGKDFSDEEWQIIDGFHRWSIAREEGYADVLIAFDPTTTWSDERAKKLTAIFIETRGDPDVALMGKLLHDLQEALGPDSEELLTGLPYSHAELDHLLQIGEVDWDAWAQQQATRGKRTVDRATLRDWTLPATDQQFEDLTRFAGMLQREGEHDTVTEAVVETLRKAAAEL
jgi:ParB-like nuclease domain